MFQYKYDRLFNYKPLENAKRGVIGIPRVLNMYENYPFWFTLFTKLGFEVVISDHSNRRIYEKGIESMPSESVCYPAKLVHGHIINLIEKDVKTIFYPCIMYETKEFDSSDNHYNCPIVTSYSEAIKLNVEALKENNIKYMNPFLPFESKGLYKRIMELDEFKEYKFKSSELKEAIEAATKEQQNFKEDIRNKGEEFIKYLEKHKDETILRIALFYQYHSCLTGGDLLLTKQDMEAAQGTLETWQKPAQELYLILADDITAGFVPIRRFALTLRQGI
jgi:predicted nucleotide-binding protein (sugar kinase/HSP70/actin superfamily)